MGEISLKKKAIAEQKYQPSAWQILPRELGFGLNELIGWVVRRPAKPVGSRRKSGVFPDR